MTTVIMIFILTAIVGMTMISATAISTAIVRLIT